MSLMKVCASHIAIKTKSGIFKPMDAIKKPFGRFLLGVVSDNVDFSLL